MLVAALLEKYKPSNPTALVSKKIHGDATDEVVSAYGTK